MPYYQNEIIQILLISYINSIRFKQLNFTQITLFESKKFKLNFDVKFSGKIWTRIDFGPHLKPWIIVPEKDNDEKYNISETGRFYWILPIHQSKMNGGGLHPPYWIGEVFPIISHGFEFLLYHFFKVSVIKMLFIMASIKYVIITVITEVVIISSKWKKNREEKRIHVSNQLIFRSFLWFPIMFGIKDKKITLGNVFLKMK